MNILRALDDEQVFRPFFRGTSWDAWRVFLATLFGLPLSEEQLALYCKHTGRSTPPSQPSHEAWLICGRRSGKSFVLATVAVFLAAFRDWRPFLGPGERGTIMVVAADRRQSRVIMRYVCGMLRSVPMLAQLIESETQERVDLRNRVTIEVHTASFRSTRGYAIVAGLLDELAFWPTDEGSSEPDTEIIAAIKPGTATIPGAMLLCASSPYARRGALWDAHRRHFGKDGDPVLVWHAPTRDMNPTVPERIVAEAMERDPASAAAEFCAQFRLDVESFVSRDAVESCVSLGVRERPPVLGIRYAGFADPSGGSADSFTLAIAHQQESVAVIDALREIRPPFSPESAVGELARLLRSYRVNRIQSDRYAGEWPAEQFRKHGITLEAAPKPKSDLYRDFLPLVNSRQVDLLDHPRAIAQLCSLERRVARGGRDSIDHPPGAHDDLGNAIAGVAVMLGGEAARLAAYTSMKWVGGGDDAEAYARQRLHDHINAGAQPRPWRSVYW
jgi:hypothetical protein